MAEGADLKSVQYRFESDGGDVLNAREWAELWHSLTREEQEAVLAMKRRELEWREQEFYEAKAKRNATKKET